LLARTSRDKNVESPLAPLTALKKKISTSCFRSLHM
jgi:hypothetical protein